MKKIVLVWSLLFIFLFLFVGCNKSSSDWVEYRNNESGVYSYKKVNIDKEGIGQLWVKQVFSDKSRKNIIQGMIGSGISTEGWDKLSEKKMLIEQDCKNHRERILSLTVYDSDGKVLQSHEDDKTNWNDIMPASPEGVLHKIFCK